MAKDIFAGGKLNSVVASPTCVDSTTAGTFDPTRCDASLLIPAGQSVEITYRGLGTAPAPESVVTGETLYDHFDFYLGANVNTSGYQMREWLDAAGLPWFALRGTGAATNEYKFHYNSGTGAAPVWTAVGAPFVLAASVRVRFDVKIKLGAPHQFEVSINATLVASGSFTQGSLTSVQKTIHRAYPSQPVYISQLMATEGRSTVGGYVDYKSPNGAGNSSGMTGTFADVGEAVNNDATTVSSATAGQRQDYAFTGITVPTGFTISSVWNWKRAKNDGVAPQNLKGLARSGGADTLTTNLPGIGTSFGALAARWDIDPATGVEWTATGFNAAKFGGESAA